MAGPVRKAGSGGRPGRTRFALRLSLPVAGLLAAVLVVAVGWSFFMGYINLGRGQTPNSAWSSLPAWRTAPAATPARPLADTLRDARPKRIRLQGDRTPPQIR